MTTGLPTVPKLLTTLLLLTLTSKILVVIAAHAIPLLSIKPNVKQATSQSPESLQLQKEEWLQNRDILNNAINDSKAGMGATSQKAFENMTNLYEAKTNLLSKAKIETTPQPSKIVQFAKDHPVVTGGIVGETGRKLITGGF